jgi:DNA-directed RNA polymerase specialized sigma24 family protein
MMTREEYGTAYQRGFQQTVRFLISRGLTGEGARETAQAAWAKGWERLGQLRDKTMLLTWMNSIALNIHRSFLRREPRWELLTDLPTAPQVNVAAIDVNRALCGCKRNDRIVLERYYLDGYKTREIAQQESWTETAVRVRLCRARRIAGENLNRPELALAG